MTWGIGEGAWGHRPQNALDFISIVENVINVFFIVELVWRMAVLKSKRLRPVATRFIHLGAPSGSAPGVLSDVDEGVAFGRPDVRSGFFSVLLLGMCTQSLCARIWTNIGAFGSTSGEEAIFGVGARVRSERLGTRQFSSEIEP